MKSSQTPGKPTLETLLRLKRAERPEPEFWQQFEAELRRKQLVATIEPTPWWFGLAMLSRKLAPVGLPVGAAAALALAAVSYQTVAVGPEPAVNGVGTTVANGTIEQPGTVELASITTIKPPVAPIEMLADDTATVDLVAEARPVRVAENTPVEVIETPASTVLPPVPMNVTLASLLPGMGVQRGDTAGVADPQTTSQRYIAYNLAAVREDNPELGRVPRFDLVLAGSTQSADETSPPTPPSTAQASMEISPRNARLLALVTEASAEESALVSAGISRAGADRLSDDVLYASANRLGLGGDRLSIRF